MTYPLLDAISADYRWWSRVRVRGYIVVVGVVSQRYRKFRFVCVCSVGRRSRNLFFRPLAPNRAPRQEHQLLRTPTSLTNVASHMEFDSPFLFLCTLRGSLWIGLAALIFRHRINLAKTYRLL